MSGDTTNGLIGDRVTRTEDAEFVTGQAEYTDDIATSNAAHAAVLRSQHAHAKVHDIDTSAAEELDGVIAVYTAEDMEEAETSAPRKIPSMSTDYIQVEPELFRPVIASDRVHYQGEPLAIALAEDRYTANDAVDRIEVDYERLESVTDPEAAIEDDAPTLFEDYPNNIAYDWEFGDKDEVDEAFEDAEYVASASVDEQRLIPDPLEPRATVADYDSSSNELSIQMSTQTPHSDRHAIAGILRHPENKIHVQVPRVGGGFGAKIHNYDVESLVPWCARELERPVRWQATRSEIHQTSSHGRGLNLEGEAAFDEDGKLLGVRVDGLADLGGYVSSHVHMLTTVLCIEVINSQYELPKLYSRIRGALTNATCLDSYRGVHEVAAITFIERLMHESAKEIGMDPAELRRRNQIPADAFPYETVTGTVYDSGNYQQALEKTLDVLEYDELRERQEELREDGRYLGIGLSAYTHVSGVGPADVCKEYGIFKTHWESGRITVHQSGTVTAYCGTMDFGMGHQTSYAQIVADKLGVPIEDVEIIEGDTRHLNDGVGTHASRSLVVGGSALAESADDVIEKGRSIVAHQLEAPEEDIEFEDGEFWVKGAPERSMTIQEVGSQAHRAWDVPGEPGLEATTYYLPEQMAITSGVHAAVVEVDPDTGEVEFERYLSVDDAGNRINPQIVEGQLHGGIAQGISQALYEDVVYDDNGNMVTSTLQDYAMPKSFHVPEVETVELSTPAPDNPLGAKGVGETGPIAGNAAVLNAVVDALEPLGFDGSEVDTPLTPEKIWKGVNDQD
ncbi:xanthine dehydrogenase family protein molybdopterin-binding subunit [Natrialba sp. INN-245]|uniref:xanthine dehydrogenase family protein molybdopterin-binding subunit n=1 Tax=Natrialba sp. INN-245 TaxID=2690967 RepID=UPI001312B243|nr:xanthine dehydrogenase family protein molybdopterin-binding subunit [Natrialba sp. INN-245]MWV38411.1 molybdopterin-dependent oxidoreductase [Natrialba sp. INN-245]